MEHKYLADGRKVVVIGQLNNVESIVQEVFVTEGGDEIPSGEKFTTKNLHDEPVISWKAKDEAKQDARLLSVKGEIDRTNNDLSNLQTKLKAFREIFKQSKQLSETLDEQNLDILSLVMSGSVEYLVILGYGVPELVKFEDAIMEKSDYGRFESLKLLSLFGASNGDLTYGINRWRDGSGSSTPVHPYQSLEEAKAMIERIVLDRIEGNRFPGVGDLNKLRKIGITFSGKIAKKIKDHIASSNAKAITSRAEETAKMVKRHKEEASNLKAALSPVR